MITELKNQHVFKPPLSLLEANIFSIIAFADGRVVSSAEIATILDGDGSSNNPRSIGVIVQRINEKSTTGPVISSQYSRGYRYEST